jgi:hypothetical protein
VAPSERRLPAGWLGGFQPPGAGSGTTCRAFMPTVSAAESTNESAGSPDFWFFRSTRWINTRIWNAFSQEGQIGIEIQLAESRKLPDLVETRLGFTKVNLKIK